LEENKMRQNFKIKKTLEDTLKVGAIVAAGDAGVAALEYIGLPGYFQQYEIAKSAVKTQFFGSFIGNFQYYASYLQRFIFDAAAFGIPAYFTGSYLYGEN
jgi:hypothetical protein